MSGPWTVYVIRNLTNGKSYVGITSKPIELRFSEHIRAAFPGRRGPNGRLYALHAAIQKYGIKSFKIEKLEDNHDLNMAQKREQFFIQKLKSYGSARPASNRRGYNQSLGGETPDTDELLYASASLPKNTPHQLPISGIVSSTNNSFSKKNSLGSEKVIHHDNKKNQQMPSGPRWAGIGCAVFLLITPLAMLGLNTLFQMI